MQLLLRRSTRAGAFHRVIYVLDVRARLSDDERDTIVRHGLAARSLYERSELSDRGRGLLGLLSRLVYRAGNLTISVADLMKGRRVETSDLSEILSLEDLVKVRARAFSMLVRAAGDFVGDEVLEL
jgi:hypothetical protein